LRAGVGGALALILCAAQDSEEPHVVTRRFVSELELASERFELTGSEGANSDVQRPPAQVREEASEVEVLDTLFDSEEPPQRFERLYKTVQGSFALGDRRRPRSKTQSAGLEGKNVTFERERDGSYTRTCPDTSVRAGQLKRLRAELALDGFLPPPDGASDEAWEIDAAQFARLFAPLENEPRAPRAKPVTPKGGLDLAPAALSVPLAALLAKPEGTVTARPGASSADDELPCQATLEFALESSFDGSELLLGGLEAEAEDRLEVRYAGKGTLAWDPKDGRITIECEGEARFAETFTAEIEGNGKTARVEGVLELGGTLTLAAGQGRAP
jgi:hypothetical protein